MKIEDAKSEAMRRWGSDAVALMFSEISPRYFVADRIATKSARWGRGDSFEQAFKRADVRERYSDNRSFSGGCINCDDPCL